MDIPAYLNRINYEGPLDPSAETLRRLHLAHRMTVPFENLSIGLGERIVLEDEALFNKVVMRRRGGFCYELNGLFAALLRALGFDVVMLSAAVGRDSGEFGPEFDHMALMVNLGERWLVDVGFGDSFREPLLLDDPDVQTQGESAFRIDGADGCRLLMERGEDGSWKARYRFGLDARTYADYAEMCRHHQSSPESPFTRGRICVLAKPGGRAWISKSRLITIQDGERCERELENETQLADALREHFGIMLPG